MASFYLTHPAINSGSPTRVLCQTLTVGGKRNAITKPYATGNYPSEASVTTPENLNYTVNGVYFTNEAGTLSYDNLLTLYLTPFKGSDSLTHGAIVLSIVYGDSNQLTSKSIISEVIATSDINVVIDSFNISFDTKQTRDAYLPSGSITFVETE